MRLHLLRLHTSSDGSSNTFAVGLAIYPTDHLRPDRLAIDLAVVLADHLGPHRLAVELAVSLADHLGSNHQAYHVADHFEPDNEPDNVRLLL